ncbi:MAG: hypothetical protein U0T83_05210 [Bacteriovoracaceae bacterium]
MKKKSKQINMKKYLFFIFYILGLSINTFAATNMHKCMLLPIIDNTGLLDSFKVFEIVEKKLQESNWCYYKSNSKVIDILSQYRKNLEQHLDNPVVLKSIIEKVDAGSVIKTKLSIAPQGIELELKVLGETGEDVYFIEKTILPEKDPAIIAQTIVNWLNVYEKTIPYQGEIIGILGEQFIVDIGKASHVRPGSKLVVKRALGKKRHPLLKEIVEWEMESIGEGKIVNISEFQANGQMTSYESKKVKIRIGDWVNVDLEDTKAKDGYPEVEGYEFGKLGIFGIYFTAGQGTDTNYINSLSRKMSGIEFGFLLTVQPWITRNIFAEGDFSRKFSTYKKISGSITNSSNSLSGGFIKAKAGYRYLPLGFFYGPQIDGYAGYGIYEYNLDLNVNEGYGQHKFSGVLLGIRGNVPVFKDVRLYAQAEFLPFPTYAEDVSIFGNSAKSISSYHVGIGVNYVYSPNMSFDMGYFLLTNKAKFDAPSRDLNFQDNTVRIGLLVNF